MLVFDVELLDILRVPPPSAGRGRAARGRPEVGVRPRLEGAEAGHRHRAHPKADQHRQVHYTGWTTDGKMFDSSLAKGTPATFELTKVIPGWTEGLQLMTEGETRRFWIPKKLAYRGAAGKPEGMLVFDVELLEIVKE